MANLEVSSIYRIKQQLLLPLQKILQLFHGNSILHKTLVFSRRFLFHMFNLLQPKGSFCICRLSFVILLGVPCLEEKEHYG